jgi:hypothetical protein
MDFHQADNLQNGPISAGAEHQIIGPQGIGQPLGSDLCLERRTPPPKFYRIGEVVEYSRMSRQTIHNYTVMGLLRESKWTDGGHRLYDESVFGRLDLIAALRNRKASLETIRRHLEQLDVKELQEGEAALS